MKMKLHLVDGHEVVVSVHDNCTLHNFTQGTTKFGWVGDDVTYFAYVIDHITEGNIILLLSRDSDDYAQYNYVGENPNIVLHYTTGTLDYPYTNDITLTYFGKIGSYIP